MTNHRSFALLLVAACLIAGNASGAAALASAEDSSSPAPLAPGAYLGLKPPGETPKLLAPGIIDIPGRSVGNVVFSPDATECYFTVFDGAWTNSRILFSRYENGAWTHPALASFADGRQENAMLFSRDGNRLYFGVSASPTDQELWMVQRASREEEWSKPQPLPAPLNSLLKSFKAQVFLQTADGTMYFVSNRDVGHGDIYRTVSEPGQPLQAKNLGAPVNSELDKVDLGISPDGHTLIFFSKPNRPGVTNNATDLFICFDNGHGGWTTPVNMGEGFNTLADVEYAPTFSQDGLVLFFSRFDGKHGDVYWVSTSALERFRKVSH
jgi:hypothetical protein